MYARLSMILALLAMLLSSPAAAEEQVIVKSSAHPVAATVDRLEKIVKEKGASVFARVDHAAGAKAAGKEMKPSQLLIFGNPKLGTPLMLSDPRVGLDLPMKVLVWEDADGKVWLGYTNPASIKSRYETKGVDDVFNKIASVLNGFTEAAAKAE